VRVPPRRCVCACEGACTCAVVGLTRVRRRSLQAHVPPRVASLRRPLEHPHDHQPPPRRVLLCCCCVVC
jgi:hypothetical protein